MISPKGNFPDPADRASLETGRNFMLRIRDRERKLAGKIRKAFSREKIFLLNVLRPDLLRLSVLTVKLKKKLLREPLGFDQHIAAETVEKP